MRRRKGQRPPGISCPPLPSNFAFEIFPERSTATMWNTLKRAWDSLTIKKLRDAWLDRPEEAYDMEWAHKQ